MFKSNHHAQFWADHHVTAVISYEIGCWVEDLSYHWKTIRLVIDQSITIIIIMEVTGNMLLPFDTSDLSYLWSLHFSFSILDTQGHPNFLTFTIIYLAGYFLVVFFFVGTDIPYQCQFTYLRHTNAYLVHIEIIRNIRKHCFMKILYGMGGLNLGETHCPKITNLFTKSQVTDT